MTPSDRLKEGKPIRLCINVKEDKVPIYEAFQKIANQQDVEFTSLVWQVLEAFVKNPQKFASLPSKREKLLKKKAKQEEALKETNQALK